MATDNTPHSGARLRNAQARVEVAERRADFERQLRHEAEQEWDRLLGTQEELRHLVKAGIEVAERVAERESQKRQNLEQELNRLRGVLEDG